MSSFFDDLEDQLRSAAHSRTNPDPATPPPPRRRNRFAWLRHGVRAAPVVASLATTLVIVVGALLLLGHSQRPGQPAASPPSPGGFEATLRATPARQLRREFLYIRKGTQQVQSSRACRVQMPSGESFIHGSPGPAMLSTLGVLRRASTPSDRISSQSLSGVTDIYAGHSRLAFTADGSSYYIVPTRYDRAEWLPPSRCFSLQEAALRAYLPKIPAALRTPTRVLQAQLIAYDLGLAAHVPRDTFCLVTVSHNSGGSGCGETLAAVEHGQAVQDDNGTLVGVVPDGVAAVALVGHAASGANAFSVVAAVHGNVFAVHAASGGAGYLQPTMTWRSAQGVVLEKFTPPSRASLRDYCKRHPLPCVAVSGGGLSEESSSSSSSSGTVAAPPSPQGSGTTRSFSLQPSAAAAPTRTSAKAPTG